MVLTQRDDETAYGRLRTERVYGDLVRVPLLVGNHTISTTGGGAAPQYSSGLIGSDPGGSDSGMSVSLAPIAVGSPPFNSVRVFFPFFGGIFGVRWRLDSQTTVPNFTVMVDGEAVLVDTTFPLGPYPNLNGFSIGTNEMQKITHKQLKGDGPHMAEIIVNGANTGANRVIVLHGVLLDRAAGYTDYPRLGALNTSAAVPNASAAEIDTARTNTQQAARSIRRVYYTNTNASPRVVTLLYNTVAFKKIYLAATGSAGDTAEWDPGDAVATMNAAGTLLLKHQADNTGVTYVTQLGY